MQCKKNTTTDRRDGWISALTWWIEKAVGNVFVCSIVGAGLTEGWWHSVVRLHTVRKCFWEWRHFYLQKHHRELQS